MNNDYMNDEMEIDLIELLKDIIKNICEYPSDNP